MGNPEQQDIVRKNLLNSFRDLLLNSTSIPTEFDSINNNTDRIKTGVGAISGTLVSVMDQLLQLGARQEIIDLVESLFVEPFQEKDELEPGQPHEPLEARMIGWVADGALQEVDRKLLLDGYFHNKKQAYTESMHEPYIRYNQQVKAWLKTREQK